MYVKSKILKTQNFEMADRHPGEDPESEWISNELTHALHYITHIIYSSIQSCEQTEALLKLVPSCATSNVTVVCLTFIVKHGLL